MKRYVPQLATMVLAFGLSTAFAQNPNSAPSERSQDAAAAGQQSSGQSTSKTSNFDRQFVEKAAQANMAEIEMAQLALEKATSPEVKQLAQTIQQDHQKAQEKLQSVAQDQNINLPSEPSQKAKQEKQKLEAMSAQQFEREYVQHMVQDHKKDIKEFQQATKQASGDVQQFASSTLPALQKHLQMAQQIEGKGRPSTQAHE
jgi:putative membrane protein